MLDTPNASSSDLRNGRRVRRATLTEQVEDALRLDIIEGVFPPGHRLRSSELAKRYNVSATPLREALQRLAAQSLIDIDPRLGASVAQISQDDLHDIYWLRSVLEVLALERSLESGDGEWKEGVRAAFEALRDAAPNGTEELPLPLVLEWSQAHRNFHESLFRACSSPWLMRVLGSLQSHSERYRMLTATGGRRNTLHEHEAIMSAVLSDHRAEAVEALRRHLSNTVNLLTDGPTDSNMR